METSSFLTAAADWLLFSLEFGCVTSADASANRDQLPNRRVIMLTHTHVYCDNTLQGSSTNQQWLPAGDWDARTMARCLGKIHPSPLLKLRLRSTWMSWPAAPEGRTTWPITATKCFKCWRNYQMDTSGSAISALFSFSRIRTRRRSQPTRHFSQLAHRHEQSVYIAPGRFHQCRDRLSPGHPNIPTPA